jgi:hypothetical protein
MKIKLICFSLVGLLLVCSSGLTAQSFDGGLVAGVSNGNVKLSDMNNSLINSANGSNMTGIEGGLFSRFHFTPFYIKPMALINYQSGQLDFHNKDGSVHHDNFNAGKLEVPVLLGLHFLGILNIEAGPVYNWVYMANTNGDNELNVQPSGLGYRLGANVELWRLLVGLSYQGLINKSNSSSSTTFEVPNELFLEIAFNFGKKK